MGEWITTKIPLELAKQIDSFLDSSEGKIFPNKMQFISEALREKLEKDSSIKPQLDKIERDLAFLTEKLLYEKTRKKLIKADHYEAVDDDKLKQKGAVHLVDKMKVLKKNSSKKIIVKK